MKSVLLLVFIVPLVLSCSSLSTLQTARTLPKGQLRAHFGMGLANSEIIVPGIDTLKTNVMVQEVGCRLGVGEKFDVGLKVSLIGSVAVDGKYQFLGTHDSKVAGSIGLGAGYNQLRGDKLFATDNPMVKMATISVPLYFSYHPEGLLSFYISPRYLYNAIVYQKEDIEKSTSSHWYGLSGGIRITGGRQRVGFLAEYSYLQIGRTERHFSQVAVGLDFRFR
jgi:hypothetical protein